jgi:hypothetical protein
MYLFLCLDHVSVMLCINFCSVVPYVKFVEHFLCSGHIVLIRLQYITHDLIIAINSYRFR